MGGLIGGLIGGFGNLIGGAMQAKSADKAARLARETALTGYNYLTNGAGSDLSGQYLNTGGNANNAQAQLLGQAPLAQGTSDAFQNYLNSTGYKFRLGQGMNAIDSNAASKGLLNSGGTLKALQAYGQGLGGKYFNNYLNQLGGLSAQGQKQLAMIAGGGNTGGYAASPVASASMAGGNALANGLTGAATDFGRAYTAYKQGS